MQTIPATELRREWIYQNPSAAIAAYVELLCFNVRESKIQSHLTEGICVIQRAILGLHRETQALSRHRTHPMSRLQFGEYFGRPSHPDGVHDGTELTFWCAIKNKSWWEGTNSGGRKFRVLWGFDNHDTYNRRPSSLTRWWQLFGDNTGDGCNVFEWVDEKPIVGQQAGTPCVQICDWFDNSGIRYCRACGYSGPCG